MKPAARVQSAIEVLDRVLAGEAAERALKGWARASRFAGSKDRAAVRDHVFDALRQLRSAAWAGGLGDAALEEMEGRAVMAGLLAGQGMDVASLFDGSRHGPVPWAAPLDPGAPPEAVALDCPDWLLPPLRAALGEKLAPVLRALRHRAPIVLRVNARRATREALIARLMVDGIEGRPHPASPTAIELASVPRGLTAHPAFLDGSFELQDAGSQALVDRLPLAPDGQVLDLCAGGGGKALALAGRGQERIAAHDIDPGRLRDLPSRAERAGVRVALTTEPEAMAPFDGVIADVPCSGSGSWRRAPEAKWRLTPGRLAELTSVQDRILDRAATLVRPGGWIAYMTCSLLAAENEERADAAVARLGLTLEHRWACTPLDGCDGFHLSLMRMP